MTLSLDDLRRAAKLLAKGFFAGDVPARQRLLNYPPRPELNDLKHADFLHVIAREQGFASWPALKLAAETMGLDRAQALQRLKFALHEGQPHVTERLLSQFPDLSEDWTVQLATYDLTAVKARLSANPELATQALDTRMPMVILCFSKHIHAAPEKTEQMIGVAEALLDHGADVNTSMPVAPDNDHPLSALYGAIGHANNMVLGRWLLDHGADPNDGESLYHSLELGHHEGLRMLLEAGADPKTTNALLRAMDFDDVTAVQMLLQAGADADEFNAAPVGGEEPWVIPALHQAARRMSSPEMVDLLLAHDADPSRTFEGVSVYGYARVFGNHALSRAIEARGAPALSVAETLLATAVEGPLPKDRYIDPEILPDAYRNILRLILHLPGKLPHMERLVALGIEYDRPDREGLTPVQAAGWVGMPDIMEFFLNLKPDLSHVNGYGGTLLGTILHGSANCPERAERDYLGCLRLALHAGVALPPRAAEFAADEEVSAFLNEWAEAHPGQVADGPPR